MKYGRKDACVDNPLIKSTRNDGLFPSAKWGLAKVLEWCDKTFDLDDRECVALLGK